ncbi:hypothetical protein CYMTET_44420 [Cymbomonas tetramitiformis]|uniref:Uncharacterized protein n=1 Tax=Cymbomonas tetramitiformis TaxID=36881 RepID=A0AAE0C1H7_9CHLO|nr:hypothetical protein CYMTET_44420 [Cymbomonas tetramitiformis]
MPQWRSLFRRAGMRIEEVIPTHDAQGEPVQLMEGSNGKLVDLQQPMLVVYAPPSKQRVQRVRQSRGRVPIIHAGKAAKLRDSQEGASDAAFMEALKSEYTRDGPLNELRTKVAMTTPYIPRSDGQAEHTDRVVEDMLISFVEDNPESWDLYATNVEFAINDSRNDVTGFTPFELWCGVSPMSQLDIFSEAAQLHSGRRKGGVGTALEWASRFSSQLRDARSKLELAQRRQRGAFDQRHTQREYAVGDLVWIEAKHLTEKLMDRALCRKLSKRWHGPVAVTERFYSDLQAEMPEADRGAPVAYRLKLPPYWRVHDVFAQHRLKPYTGGEDTFALRQQTVTPEAVVVDGQKEAHVEKILSRRVRVSRGK